MRVRLIKSPKAGKKWRVYFQNATYVDFGAKGYSDYTLHKDPVRMRRYVQRHGGLMNSKNMSLSRKENWTKRGIATAGFWSRWLLWSEPSLPKAKSYITKTFGITFV